MSASEVFDVCVVGAGLWGSAAAKYCAEQPGTSVCLIGPSEPANKEDYKSRSTFGAHYDEGRVVRTIDRDLVWGKLARGAAETLCDIQNRTGVHLYSNVGFLWLTAQNSTVSRKLLNVSDEMGIEVQVLDQRELQQRYNFISFDKLSQEGNMDQGVVGFVQGVGAGHLSPRKLVLAQKILAQRQGCQVLDDVVIGLSHEETQDVYVLTTETGKIVSSKKVLLCTGASSALDDLLPAGLHLDITWKSQTVVFWELTEDDRDRLRDMPSLILERETDLGQNCYILPPIQYPDGKWYLKIGHNKVGERVLTGSDQLKAWCCGHGDPDTSQRLLRCLQGIIPDLKPRSIHTDTCVSTTTPTGRLYCDMVSPGLGILVGGNGCGAKASDKIGHMGARMILKGDWDYDLPRELFRMQLKSKI